MEEDIPTEMNSSIMANISYFLQYTWYLITFYYETYGWYILLSIIVQAYAWFKIKPYYNAYMKRREDEEYTAKYHKDPDMVLSRMNAQQALVNKLQEKYNKDAEDYQLKMSQLEEKKREERLKNQSGSSTGNKSGNAVAGTSKKNSFKSEYNPLSGDTSRGYKAPKKKTCGSGGCG